MNSNFNPSEPWRPELLAGFADGELGPADRAAVEAWIAHHADGPKELSAQQNFARNPDSVWNRDPIALPSETTWNDSLQQVRAQLNPATPSAVLYHASDAAPISSRKPVWQSRRALGIASMAAAVLFAIGLFTNGRNNMDAEFGPDSLPVARANDVEILSLQGDDAGIIVVGRPPLMGVMDLATVGDIGLEAIDGESDLRNARPELRPGDPRRPMLIVPSDKMHPVP